MMMKVFIALKFLVFWLIQKSYKSNNFSEELHKTFFSFIRMVKKNIYCIYVMYNCPSPLPIILTLNSCILFLNLYVFPLNYLHWYKLGSKDLLSHDLRSLEACCCRNICFVIARMLVNGSLALWTLHGPTKMDWNAMSLNGCD